jgi:hypothetical protein
MQDRQYMIRGTKYGSMVHFVQSEGNLYGGCYLMGRLNKLVNFIFNKKAESMEVCTGRDNVNECA